MEEHVLVGDLRKRPQHNPATNPHNERSEEKTTNRHVYVEPGVQIDFVKDLREQYKTTQESNTAHNKKVVFWTKVGAGLILVYATITFVQTCYTKKAAEQAIKSMQVEERAWVGVRSLAPQGMPHPIIAPDSDFGMSAVIENGGKSPALPLK